MDAAAYARQLKALLPPGRLWSFEPGSWLSQLLLGIADELARVHARAEVLVREWDPRTADETLAEWERVLGLPEEGESLAGSTAGRQQAATRKLIARGGQTAAYYVELAARLGFTVTVVETGAHAWRMDVQPGGYDLTATDFRAGSRAGDRLTGRSAVELERVINRLKPAHTVLVFNYL